MEKTTKRDQIEAILKEKPQATRPEVSTAIGREVFGPEISHVRKKLGIVYNRRGKGKHQVARAQAIARRRKVITSVPSGSGNGTVLIGAILNLSREYGAENVKRAADMVAAF